MTVEYTKKYRHEGMYNMISKRLFLLPFLLFTFVLDSILIDDWTP